MKKNILVLLLFVIGLILLSGCSDKATCNKPYIQVGTNCCLDQDNSGICDKDECNKPYIKVGSHCCMDQDDNGICDYEEEEEGVEETDDRQSTCNTDVFFRITSACKVGHGYKLLIQNDGKIDITKWKIRFVEDESKVEIKESLGSIDAFGISRINFVSSLTSVRLIEVSPFISVDGQEVLCKGLMESYGAITGNPIPYCTS